ncbi:MAG: TOBE domain-containing protein [Nocardioidaceae bacterium]
MPTYRLSDAAQLLGVSIDTVRRWADQDRFTPTTDQGRAAIDGEDLARIAREQAHLPDEGGGPSTASARNKLRGIVTAVKRDEVMAQVELCCGPYRVVSLLSSEAVDDLGLAPGAVATATIKATNVIVEVD